MYKIKITLDTQTQVREFVEIANTIQGEVSLIDNANHCVSAKSIVGCLYSLEFDEVYVIGDDDNISTKFDKFRCVG